MKSLALVLSVLSDRLRERRLRVVLALIGVFVVLVGLYSVVFHELMAREGQSHSWPTAIYWTLVTMTTLGFGDITFTSDAGRIFSVVVLLSGSVFLLVLLPFTFIQFVFLPWMSRIDANRAPRRMPEDLRDHVILTSVGPIEDAVIDQADRVGVPTVVMVPDLEDALRLHDLGYRVMVGDLDDQQAYRAAQVEAAAMVVATQSDTTNANIAFTVREVTDSVPIVATAHKAASVDILGMAGADEVLQLGELLGTAMAQRALAADGCSHVIGEFAGLQIAQARVAGTELVNLTLAEADLRGRLGVGIIGVWDHGHFEIAGPATRLGESSVLILAGELHQLEAYDRAFSLGNEGTDSVVILGGGRVGRAAARELIRAGTRCVIVEQQSERVRPELEYVIGDAAALEVLEGAGIHDASSVLITTHDDDVNIYLTIYCRRLRPDLRIAARANLARNVSTLYRAGADDVLSYALTGAAAIWGHIRDDITVVVAEGLDVFRVPVPRDIAGLTLRDAHLRHRTGCNVVAVEHDGVTVPNPGPDQVLPAGGSLVLIGDGEDKQRYFELFPSSSSRRRATRRGAYRAIASDAART